MSDVITKELLRRAMEHEGKQAPAGEPVFVYHCTEPQAELLAKMFGVKWQPDEKGNQRIGMYLLMTESIYLPVEDTNEPKA